MSRATFNAANGLKNFASFMQQNVPSRADYRAYAWIQVTAQKSKPTGIVAPVTTAVPDKTLAPPSLEPIIISDDDEEDAFEKVEIEWQLSEKKTQDVIDSIAARYRIFDGKWLLFPPAAQADDYWARIAKASVEGELGTAAKISTKADEKGVFCICVYTSDYRDTTDVWRVRAKLMELGFIQKLYYKPDIYTYTSIYANNPWGIPASRYCG